MSYSIFEGTMVDMTYTEIEQAAKENAAILFPISVIEEHGPHLCLGTDAYLTNRLCVNIKKQLDDLGVKNLIAPPFYWGINNATGAFTGSFTVKEETMTAVLLDTFECLHKWGFKNIFLFNFHGDFLHNKTILKAAEKAVLEHNFGVRFIIPGFYVRRAGLQGDEAYILVPEDKPEDPDKVHEPAQYADVHAGSYETSLMVKDFPELVNIELARTLKSSMTTFENLRIWGAGGEKSKEITPQGYCGNPSDINLDKARDLEEEMLYGIADLIAGHVKSNL